MNDTVTLQDELTGALIGLARATEGTTLLDTDTYRIIIEGLFTTSDNSDDDDKAIETMIAKVRTEKHRLAPDCSICASPCGRTDDYDMQNLWKADESICCLKLSILSDIRDMSAYAVLGNADDELNQLLCEALFMIGYANDSETLLPIAHKVKELKTKCTE